MSDKLFVEPVGRTAAAPMNNSPANTRGLEDLRALKGLIEVFTFNPDICRLALTGISGGVFSAGDPQRLLSLAGDV